MAKNVREISESKANTRAKNVEAAITDPKKFAQDKLKKQLRARQRKKEKIRTLKFGLADGKSAAKHKKLKTE